MKLHYFRQFLCPASGVFHCIHSSGICRTGLLCVQWKTPDAGQRNCLKHAEFCGNTHMLLYLFYSVLRLNTHPYIGPDSSSLTNTATLFRALYLFLHPVTAPYTHATANVLHHSSTLSLYPSVSNFAKHWPFWEPQTIQPKSTRHAHSLCRLINSRADEKAETCIKGEQLRPRTQTSMHVWSWHVGFSHSSPPSPQGQSALGLSWRPSFSLWPNMAARPRRTEGAKPMRLACWNADGVPSRKFELEHFLNQHGVDICFLCETFLNHGQAFRLANYVCHHTDRPTAGAVQLSWSAVV